MVNPDEIRPFLSSNGWDGAVTQPLAGDMSTRRYYRVTRGDRTAVLMLAQDAQSPFIAMTEWLLAQGLKAPGILALDPAHRLLLLEDFGDVSLRQVLDEAAQPLDEIFRGLVDILLSIRNAPAPALARPTVDDLVEMTKLADTHYRGINAGGLAGLRSVLTEQLSVLAETPASVSLRDFHSENIQWLNKGHGKDRFGLLDYQDAFLAHPVYDVVSILTDARRLVSQDERDLFLSAYLNASGDNPATFRTAFSVVSAQRNLRILGIFARAGRYAQLARPYQYFCDALEDPVFAEVRQETLRAVPAPEANLV